MSEIEAEKYYLSLPKEQQKLIVDVMLTTMCMCSELTDEPIVFFETMAYKVFRLEMLSHMLENEYYDYKEKVWKNFNENK